jgi:hypothetical protein
MKSSAGSQGASFSTRNILLCFVDQNNQNFSTSSWLVADRINNIHNHHQWAEKNPRGVVVHSTHQQQFTINVYVRAIGDHLVGPHGLTGNRYRDTLLRGVPKLLENVPSSTALMWYTPDGATAHCSRAVRDVPYSTIHDRWTDGAGPIAWPPRSTTQLIPLDLYLRGLPETVVYAAAHDNEQAIHRTVDTCQTVRNCPAISERMRRSVMRRVEVGTEFEGDNVDSL